MAGNDQLVIFISSSMEELKPERNVVWSAINAAGGFEPFAWEKDAAAHGHSAQEEWTRQLDRTDVTIVLLWKKLGQWTKEEIEISRESGIPILLFRKEDESETLKTTEGAYLEGLENVKTGLTAQYFSSLERLQEYVDQSLWGLIKDRFAVARKHDLDERSEVRGVRRLATVLDHGLSVEEAAPGTIQRLDPEEARRLPPNRWPFVGRKTEKAKLMQAIKTGDQLVALTGPGGIGKKALLKDVTHHEDFGSGFEDGAAIHPAWLDHEDLEDLLQAIWEEFYDADDPSTVQPRRRRRQLADKEALIFLPDVEASSQLILRVLDELPRAVFCITGDSLAVPGLRIPVDGLTDQKEMLAVFEGRYLAQVPAAARTHIASMCVLLDGKPSLIGFLADRARENAPDVPDAPGEHPLVPWAAQHSQLTVEELRGWLAPSEGQSAVAVAQATGVQTPRAVMIDVTGSAESIDDALADNFIEAASPHYRLNAALSVTSEDDSELMEKIFHSAVAWAGEAGATEIYANREFVLRMMAWGAGHERWSEVIKLGMATEGPMALGGRHGAWEQVLSGVATAAQAMEPTDTGTEAWALHQLGSRALLRDELKEARILLHEALLRRPGDEDQAIAVTHRNLSLVPAAIVPLAVLLLSLVFLVAWAGALFAPGPATLIADVDPDFAIYKTTNEEMTFSVTNVGTGSFTVGSIRDAMRKAFPEGFALGDDNCSESTLRRFDSCKFTVEYLGGTHTDFLDIPLESAIGTVEGDLAILLVGRS